MVKGSDTLKDKRTPQVLHTFGSISVAEKESKSVFIFILENIFIGVINTNLR